MTIDTANPGTDNGGTTPAAGADAATATPWYDTSYGPLVETKGWKSANDALQSYANLEKTLGADKIALPGKDAKPEDWDAVWNKLGRPEKPDGYAFQAPENLPGYDQGFADWFRDTAHKAGLNGNQAAALHDAFVAFSEQEMAAREEANREGEAKLRQEWGRAFDQKVALAKRATQAFGGDVEILDKLEGALGYDGVVKMFSAIGEAMGEDAIKGGGGSGFAMTPDAAKAEIAKIQGDSKSPYYDKMHPEHKLLVEKMERLHRVAYPE